MDIQYDINALKEAINKCDVNIQTFEDAILREHETKAEYRKIIRVLENGSDDKPTPKS